MSLLCRVFRKGRSPMPKAWRCVNCLFSLLRLPSLHGNINFRTLFFFSISTTVLELGLIVFASVQSSGVFVFLFIAIIRTISFIALGIFINLLVNRLREQSSRCRRPMPIFRTMHPRWSNLQ